MQQSWRSNSAASIANALSLLKLPFIELVSRLVLLLLCTFHLPKYHTHLYHYSRSYWPGTIDITLAPESFTWYIRGLCFRTYGTPETGGLLQPRIGELKTEILHLKSFIFASLLSAQSSSMCLTASCWKRKIRPVERIYPPKAQSFRVTFPTNKPVQQLVEENHYATGCRS